MRHILLSALLASGTAVMGYQLENVTGPNYPVITPRPKSITHGDTSLTLDSCNFALTLSLP